MKELIENISKSTMKILWNLSNERDIIKSNSSRLIFPKDRQPKHNNNQLRISEQEARIIFIQELLLHTNNILYSIETPTIEKYCFSENAKGKRSGSLDLCLFIKDLDNKAKRILNVEFKAHNMAKSFSNDFEKLFREKGDGLFFHLLNSANNRTLTSLTGKYNSDLNKNKGHFKRDKIVYFILGFLKPKIMLMTSLKIEKISDSKFFDIDYKIENGEFKIKTDTKTNWRLIKF